MRAGHRDSAARCDVTLIEVADCQPHVGALFAKEDVRVRAFAFDAEDHEGGQSLRVGRHVSNVDAFARQRLAHELAHLLVADSSQHRGAHAETSGAGREVGGRAAEILREALHVLEAAAELLTVQIDRGASETDQVERAIHFFDPPLPSNSGGRQKAASGFIVHACSAVNSGTV